MATIKEFKSLVAPDVLPCPDPIVNREVVSVLLEFCGKTHLLTREMSLTIDSDEIDSDMQDSLDFDVSEYIESLRPVSVLEMMVDTTSYIPKRRFIQQTLSNWTCLKETGVRYYYIPDDHLIRVYDIATAESALYMRLACKPRRNVQEVDDFLLEDWSEAIVAGAKFKLLSMPGKDWSDPRAAQFYRSEWRKYLSRAKADATRNLPGEVSQVNPIDFEYGV